MFKVKANRLTNYNQSV